MTKIVLNAAWALLLAVAVQAQEGSPQTFTIPLTRPGEAVTLDISILSARMTVIGEERQDAEFVVRTGGQGRRIITPSGAKALNSGGFGIEIEERNNSIEVDADWRSGTVEIEARIPRRANLNLSTTNDGSIEVRGVSGELQLQNVNGPITATGISGSVIAETVNDHITVTLVAIDKEKPMAFSSVNGDLDVSFPADAGLELHIDSAQGEIYSDFEVEVVPTPPRVERRETGGGIEVRVDSEVVARIGGGGTAVRFETLNGDIRVRKTGG